METEGGEVRRPEELSRGTAEQLYLALRFGLIEEFARHAEPLPVVMDDILVNFDEARTERAGTRQRLALLGVESLDRGPRGLPLCLDR